MLVWRVNLTHIDTFYVELVKAKNIRCNHINIWFQIGIYAVCAEFTLTGIYFSYQEDCLDNQIQMKKVKQKKRDYSSIRLRFIYDCVSFAKAILNKGGSLSPKHFFERIK